MRYISTIILEKVSVRYRSSKNKQLFSVSNKHICTYHLMTMVKIKKLETICLKIVMDLGIPLRNEIIPTQLMKKIKEIQAINGKYHSVDGRDYINFIQMSYDGETIELLFRKNESLHTIMFDNHIEIPINKELFYFVQLEEGATMRACIELIEDTTSLKLSAEDSQWKWNLKMEIR